MFRRRRGDGIKIFGHADGVPTLESDGRTVAELKSMSNYSFRNALQRKADYSAETSEQMIIKHDRKWIPKLYQKKRNRNKRPLVLIGYSSLKGGKSK